MSLKIEEIWPRFPAFSLRSFLPRRLLDFEIVATRGTGEEINRAGIDCQQVYKVNEGRPNVVDWIKSNKIDLVINTPLGRESFYDEKAIQCASIQHGLPSLTTMEAGFAAVSAIQALQRGRVSVRSLQEHHG